MKNADDDARLKPGRKQSPNAPSPPEPGKEHPANPGSGAHRVNQEELSVDAEHRTEEMRKEKRGTFP